MTLGRAYFEYRCYEGEDSSDAELWHHTHQVVDVLRELGDEDRDLYDVGRMFIVRFADGLEYSAWHSELFREPERHGGFMPEGEAPWYIDLDTNERADGEWSDNEPDRADYAPGDEDA